MIRPVRIQLSRKKGFNLQSASLAINGLPAINVARPTLWGNPFTIGTASGCDFSDGGDPAPMIVALSREQAIDFYRQLVDGFISPEMHPHGHRWMTRFKKTMHGAHPAEEVRYLRGHNLACFCGLGEHCHADVLLDLANPPCEPHADGFTYTPLGREARNG